MTKEPVSRRGFLATSAMASAAALVAGVAVPFARAAGDEKLKVGLIGCGGRGKGAAGDCLKADPGVQIWAVGDLFPDRTNEARSKFGVPEERCFSGWDNYQKVLASGVDLVILATPPGFRPLHLKAAVEAGKHVFMEKPVAVDPVGVRSVIASAEAAKQKKLSIVAGTQRRHQPAYLETIRRIQEGSIGKIIGGQVYWMGGGLWVHDRQPNWTDMEYQLRNWLYYTWLSGDHIVEQHVHNIDVMNWAIGATPVKCIAIAGRQVRVQPQYGHIYDHFAVEFEYPDGVRIASYCSQQEGTGISRVSERVVGTSGTSDCGGHIWGEKAYNYDGPNPNPYVQEHADLIKSIRNGEGLNEGQRIAESTLCAIMGRMSAYTGRELSFKWAMESSKLDLSPPKYEFGPMEVPPVAVPGQAKLI